jgi:UDP-N-acetylglucosamine/UDP-N-acetylgalactosamine diphosphorylase
MTVPTDLQKQLKKHGQDHVLADWTDLPADRRTALVDQLTRIDLAELATLYAGRDEIAAVPAGDRLAPVPMLAADAVDPVAARLGPEALARGELAVLLVAGGQGSRLGFDKPKGMFPIGPVSNKTLFQIHADKVFALGRRYGKPVPFLVMTSPATHADTVAYFKDEKFFGLGESNVFFFQQGTMPAVDIATGKLLLEAPGVLFTSPNGHGGTLTAAADSGVLDEIAGRGVKHVFYFQVDNPLVKIGDPSFFGQHLATGSEASSRAISKAFPKEKMGVLALIDGRCGIVEYSDLPDELAHRTNPDGSLTFRAGNPAIHIFAVDFLRRVTRGASKLPFHIARKKVPHTGEPDPKKENALKFEMFVFDALPMADRWLVVESPRAEEFSPVKNATGADAPETTRRDLSNLAGTWLEKAGVTVPRDSAGNVTIPLEVSPRFALDADELKARVWPGQTVEKATYYE